MDHGLDEDENMNPVKALEEEAFENPGLCSFLREF